MLNFTLMQYIRAIPPTSPERAWTAGRQTEHDQRVLGSPPFRRCPPSAASMTSNIPDALIVSVYGFHNILLLKIENCRTTLPCLYISIQACHVIRLNIFMFSECIACVLLLHLPFNISPHYYLFLLPCLSLSSHNLREWIIPQD
jgi:hypothetical protein